jgi:hypothetical protein
MVLPTAPNVVAPSYRAVPPGGGGVEAHACGRGSARPDRVVPSALELDRAVLPALPLVTGVGGW